MALIALPDPSADSYVDLAYADAYHASFGNSAWGAATVEARETALRRAAQYVDLNYRFAGYALDEEQPLAWPRSIATWPVKAVQQAASEIALRALSGAIFSDSPERTVKSEKVGDIAVEYVAPNEDPAAIRGQRISIADALLYPYTVAASQGNGRGTIRLNRA